MKPIRLSRRDLLATLAAGPLLMGSRATRAQSVSAPRIGAVQFASGVTNIVRGGTNLGAAAGTAVQVGDVLRTGQQSELHIKFDDAGYIALRQDSELRVNDYVAHGEASDSALLTLARGALRSVTGWIGKLGRANAYRINTPTATIGVRGTDHELVIVSPEMASAQQLTPGVHDRVNQGAVTLANSGGTLEIPRGSAAYAAQGGGAPQMHAIVPPLFNRLRTRNEARVREHAQQIQQHIEAGLRERGKLRPGEGAREFIQRTQREQRRAGAPARPKPLGASTEKRQRREHEPKRRKE